MTQTIEDQLNKMAIPAVEMKRHQQALRRALLTSSHWDRKPSLLSNLMVFVKGGEKNMNIKRFAFAGLFVAILIAGVFAITSTKTGSSTVYAKELAQKTYQTVSNLPTDKQEQLKTTLGMDSRTVLQEAQNAKDLKGFSYEEFAKSNPLPPDPDGKLKTLKFLQFTRADGQVVVLGIDPTTNLPVFGSVRGEGVNPAGASGEKSFNTQFRGDKGDGQGLVNCTTENGVEKCEKVSE